MNLRVACSCQSTSSRRILTRLWLRSNHGSRHWWTRSNLREALAHQLSEVYGVHKDVILCRLDREEFWPTR